MAGYSAAPLKEICLFLVDHGEVIIVWHTHISLAVCDEMAQWGDYGLRPREAPSAREEPLGRAGCRLSAG